MSEVAMQQPVIACRDLSKSFREGEDAVEVLSKVSLEVARGERVPTPGPPPPCGIQNVLCRLRWETSEPHLPGLARPTSAFMLAPSVYTWPPCLCTISQISTTSSSNTPCVEG